MAASAIFCRVLLLVLNTVALLHRHRHLLPLGRHSRLLRAAAATLMVLGASAICHAVAAGPNDDTEAIQALAAAGFFMWVAGVGLLLLALTPGRFPPPVAAAPALVAAQLVQAAVRALL